MTAPLIIRRREIREADLTDIRGLLQTLGHRGRTYVATQLCQLWDWRQANGRYREIACRDLLRQLEKRRLIDLPAPLQAARRAGYQNRVPTLPPSQTRPLAGSLAQFASQLRCELVHSPAQHQLYKACIGHAHYLGYQQARGEQLNYLCWWGEQVVACLGFGPGAWKVAARDAFIGWSAAQRQAHLAAVVNNERFLILPWVQIPHLASWALGQCVRRLRRDWVAVYGHAVVLVETFVEADRFQGHCYRAANWQSVGWTQGRGRNDAAHQGAQPLKQIWVYPLRADFRRMLGVSGEAAAAPTDV